MLGAEVVKQAVREAQQRARDGRIKPVDVLPAALAALPPAPALLRRVINATGVVLHGRRGGHRGRRICRYRVRRDHRRPGPPWP